MDEHFGEPYDVINNFNDILTGVQTLFFFIFLDNQDFETQMFVFATGKYYSFAFWVTWYVVLPLICYNVMIGLIIDYLVFELKKQEKI
jgi:hypothetical protein